MLFYGHKKVNTIGARNFLVMVHFWSWVDISDAVHDHTNITDIWPFQKMQPRVRAYFLGFYRTKPVEGETF